jgi:hypothetical protein
MICSLKVFGGLGVKNLRLLNMALKMRCRWLEMEEKDKPCKGLQFSIREVYEDIFRAAKKSAR